MSKFSSAGASSALRHAMATGCASPVTSAGGKRVTFEECDVDVGAVGGSGREAVKALDREAVAPTSHRQTKMSNSAPEVSTLN
jgi:hypothetical protein